MANPIHTSTKKEKRQIPDPVDYLRSKGGSANGPQNAGQHAAGGEPQGFSKTMTPGASGRTMPTTHDGATNGKKDWGKGPKAVQGQDTPASKAKGNGKSKKELSPNNTKKAGSMVHGPKGKNPFGTPSKNALARRLQPSAGIGQGPQTNGQGRSGILSKFEGFSSNKA